MQMRQRDVAALDAKYTKELADAKAENDTLRDDVAAGRRPFAHRRLSVSGETTTASGVDNAASPMQHRWTGLFHPQRGWSLCKNNWKEPKYINEQWDRVAHIDGQLMQLLWAIHTRFQQYKCLK